MILFKYYLTAKTPRTPREIGEGMLNSAIFDDADEGLQVKVAIHSALGRCRR